MKEYRIAVLPGDGIGPDVMNEALKVLKILSEIDSTFTYETTEFNWNTDHYVTHGMMIDRKSTRLNSSHVSISYAVFCLKKKITVEESVESPAATTRISLHIC